MSNFIKWIENRDPRYAEKFANEHFLNEQEVSPQNQAPQSPLDQVKTMIQQRYSNLPVVQGPVRNTIINKFQLQEILRVAMKKQGQGTGEWIQIKLLIEFYLKNYDFVTEKDWEMLKSDPNSVISSNAKDAEDYCYRQSYFSGPEGGGSGSGKYQDQVDAIKFMTSSRGPGLGFLSLELPSIPTMNWSGGTYNALIWIGNSRASYSSGAGTGAGAGAGAGAGTSAEGGGAVRGAAVSQEPAQQQSPSFQRRILTDEELRRQGINVPSGQQGQGQQRQGQQRQGQQRQGQQVQGQQRQGKKVISPDGRTGVMGGETGEITLDSAKAKAGAEEAPDIFGAKKTPQLKAAEVKYGKLDLAKNPDPYKQRIGVAFKSTQPDSLTAYFDGNLGRIAVVNTETQEPALNHRTQRPVIVNLQNNETSGFYKAIMQAWEDSHNGEPLDPNIVSSAFKGIKKSDGTPIEFAKDIVILNRPLMPGESYPNRYVVASKYGGGGPESYGKGVQTLWDKETGSWTPADKMPAEKKAIQPQMVWNNQLGRYVPYRSPYR